MFNLQEEIKNFDFAKVVNLPKQTIGKFSIKHTVHKKGERITAVNMRTAIYTGLQPYTIAFDAPVTFHSLVKEGQGTMMTDLPQEQVDHIEAERKCKGSVLIGGLGLGYIAKKLLLKDSVENVIIVEKEKNIIKLVAPALIAEFGDRVKIAHADLFKWLETKTHIPYHFDYAYYDIWYHDDTRVLWDYCYRLRRLSVGIKQENILQWKEDVMVGMLEMQLKSRVAFGLQQTISMPEKDFRKFYKIFNTAELRYWEWCRRVKPSLSRALKAADRYIKAFKDRKIIGFE